MLKRCAVMALCLVSFMGVDVAAAPKLLDASIEDIQVMLSTGDISSVDLVQWYTARIETFTIPMLSDRTEWDRELETLIAALKPDLVVSAGFMRILSERITSRFKIINSHPALLPLFPGAHAVSDALQAGASQSGTTIHWVDSGLDTGEVIAQERCDIRRDDTEESLHERIKIAERKLIVATLQTLLADHVRS